MRLARPFVLLAVAVLLAPPAEASRTSAGESGSPATAALARAGEPGPLASLAPAARLEMSPLGNATLDDTPRFDLGDVVLEPAADDRARAPAFHLGAIELLTDEPPRGPPASYPETRVRGLELSGPFRVGTSPSLSLWSRQACGFACPGIASDSRYDPWGLCLGLDDVPCSDYGKEFVNQFSSASELKESAKRSGKFLAGEVRGAVKAIPSLVKGVAQVVGHPVDTARGIYGAAKAVVADPVGTAKKAGNAILNADPEKAAEFAGETLALAGLGAAAKTTEGAAALSKLKGAFSFADVGEAAAAGIADYGSEVARVSASSGAGALGAGAAGGGGVAAAASATQSPLQILQGVTDAMNARLSASPALGLTVMSGAEQAVARNLPFVARMQYGNALERLVALEIQNTPALDAMFRHVGGPFRPDFVGRVSSPAIGMRFDITTQAGVAAHLARPYGAGLQMVTYARPQGFTVFP